MKTTKMITFGAMATVGALLAGCAGGPMGDYTGTERGVDFQYGSLIGTEIRGRSTTYKTATELPLGTLVVTPEGAIDMTGPGVETMAKMLYCREAPLSRDCTGG